MKNTIYLRPVSRKDIQLFFNWHQDYTIRKEAMIHPFPVSLENEEDWIENILKSQENKNVYFAIEEIETNKCIGYVNLKNINWISRNCYFGIVIGDKQSRGKGYGQKATNLAIEYAFNQLNLNKVTLEVLKENSRAIHIYEKVGFLFEGELKKHFYSDGTFHNVQIMSILRNNL